MAKVTKKSVAFWDGGITTSVRDSNNEVIDAAQMVKNFDFYTDSRKLTPMQSWTPFATTAEKAYNIRGVGGFSDTVYGIGKKLSNWYGMSWDYRIQATVDGEYATSQGVPYLLDLSNMPAGFWSNTNSDGSDIRVTTNDHTPVAAKVENFDQSGQTGQLWIDASGFTTAPLTEQVVNYYDQNGTGGSFNINGASSNRYAYEFSFTPATQTVNRAVFTAYKTGSPGDLVVELYADNAGNPGTFIQTLGTVSASDITTDTSYGTYTLDFADYTFTSAKVHIVFSATGIDGSNQYTFQAASTGTTAAKWHTTAYTPGATNNNWSTADSTMTPHFEMGYATTLTSTINDSVYIYYGNSSAQAIPDGITGVVDYSNQPKNVWDVSGMRWAFNFADGDYVLANNYDNQEIFTTEPNYVEGLIGNAITTSAAISTDPDDLVYLSGNDITVSFNIYLDQVPSTTKTILTDNNSDWIVQINNTGKILWTVDGVSGTATKTSTDSLAAGQWYVIDCVYDGNYYIAIDGVKETFTDADGNLDDTSSGQKVTIDTNSFCTIGNVWGFNNDLTSAAIATKYNYFTDQANFWTIGSQEAFTDITPNYDGVQVYSKSITSGDWTEYLQAYQPAGTLDAYLVNSFVEQSGSDIYFISSQSPEEEDLWYLSKTDPFVVLDENHLLLTVYPESVKIRPTVASPIDKAVYFTYGSTSIGKMGDPGSSNIYAGYSQINSMVAWRNYMALGSSRRTRANMEIWDLVASTPVEFVDSGTGNMRIVGNASDILFGVIDNYIDDATLSSGKPTMEIKQYIGNGRAETVIRKDIPTTYTGWTDHWERAVSNWKLRRNDETIFYAKLPADDSASTFDEGLWAVGKNSRGELALSLLLDTEGFDIENLHGFAQQVFIVEKDGGIQRLATDGTYTGTSLYQTRKMNEGNTEIDKKLHGVELVTEPLEAGQTITVYYKTDADASRVKIGEFTGEDEISVEFTTKNDGTNLPNYKEIEFDIESTGGGSSILEFSYKYEYLGDII